MADPTADLATDDAEARDDRGPSEGMPGWVKASLIIGVVVVLAFLIAHATGVAGDRGPGSHGGSDGTPVSVVDDNGGHRSPVDHVP